MHQEKVDSLINKVSLGLLFSLICKVHRCSFQAKNWHHDSKHNVCYIMWVKVEMQVSDITLKHKYWTGVIYEFFRRLVLCVYWGILQEIWVRKHLLVLSICCHNCLSKTLPSWLTSAVKQCIWKSHLHIHTTVNTLWTEF